MSKQKDESIYRKGWNDGFAKGAAAARFQLEAENAKLREELEVVGTAAYLYGRDDLKAENAKLRELVLHMHTCLEHYEPGDTISCEQCPYDNETWGCDYERLMAELGIEVDA